MRSGRPVRKRGYDYGQDYEHSDAEDPEDHEEDHVEGTRLFIRDLSCIHPLCRCIRIVDAVQGHDQAGDNEEQSTYDGPDEDDETSSDISIVYLSQAGEDQGAECCNNGTLLRVRLEPDPAFRADLRFCADQLVSTLRTEV